jgi:hypothetical protein
MFGAWTEKAIRKYMARPGKKGRGVRWVKNGTWHREKL